MNEATVIHAARDRTPPHGSAPRAIAGRAPCTRSRSKPVLSRADVARRLPGPAPRVQDLSLN
jgi:hypothetical protein